MTNRLIYSKDPSMRKLVNEGVANVNDERTDQALAVLRYELETFVCDGQYEKGLEHILETYLKNVSQAQQPAVWVSGFFGSGKSHLVKMLRALWSDTQFSDGATARSIASLPQNIKTLLVELTAAGKRYGGLHAASGTLGSSASGSVRLALLQVIYKSTGLPEQYPIARFVMWLKQENIYQYVKDHIEAAGYGWQEELDNFYVAEGLYQALAKAKPHLFSSPSICVETLNNLYPHVQDISNDEMIKAILQALTFDGKFPLTLIALDEVQQYIGEDSQRSIEVQEVVESCCKKIGGKLLFIGTGQTAVTGTHNLKKLEGRFTVRVELSDADVEAVIRKVILAKKPDSIGEIDAIMQTNLGEISRHLSNTSISHNQEDVEYFAQDYPILPVRRRFWELVLRVLDPTGTDSQLRNQLSMVHKAIQTNLDSPLGTVIPADYIYYDLSDKLLQARKLPRKVHEKTMTWSKGSADEKLVARACGLVFLINKLSGENKEIGIRATSETIADLMIEDLSSGSGNLRSKLPGLLDKCELLMKVEDEYRIQTEESQAWNDEFLSQRNQLANEAHRLETERDDRIRRSFASSVSKLSIRQGSTNENRDLSPVLAAQLPADAGKKICVWVRDGWSIDENSVRAEARQAGNESPTIFVFVPKRSADDLRHNLIDFKAATATLDKRGVPNGPEGTEARAAIETIKQVAEGKIKELLEEAFSGAHVFQGGGNEIVGNSLQEMVIEAAQNALQRLYPQFSHADHAGWGKVYDKAKQGAPDALKAVAFYGEPAKNPVCKTILAFIAGGKKGIDIRTHFEASPYGWPRDAIDGGLQVLLVAGQLRVQDAHGKIIESRELERKTIGKVDFKVESTTVSTQQRIQIRKVLQRIGIQAKQGDEIASIPDFLIKMSDLASRAGGDAPKPELPDSSSIEEIRLTAGNEQLLAIFNQADELKEAIELWEDLAERIGKRWPTWELLKELLKHSNGLPDAEEMRQQADAIMNQRLLLTDPDSVQPLLKSLEDALRKELTSCHKTYSDELSKRLRELEADATWKQLAGDERDSICEKVGIIGTPKPDVGTYRELLETLREHPIVVWRDRLDALSGRFGQARVLASKLLEPETQTVDIPRRTLKSDEDIEVWVNEVKEQLKKAIAKGPVVIQ